MYSDIECVKANILSHALRFAGISLLTMNYSAYKHIIKSCKSDSCCLFSKILDMLLDRRTYICAESAGGIPALEYHGVTLLYDVKRSITAEFSIKKRCSNVFNVSDRVRQILKSILPRSPLFVIDFLLFDLLSIRERRLLVKQLLMLIDLMRRRLTTANIVLVNVPESLLKYLDPELKAFLMLYNNDTGYLQIDGAEPIILDPYALQSLTEADVTASRVFISGGIVDEEFPRPYATTFVAELIESLTKVKSRSIMLRGNRVGVPDRVNKVVSVVLDVMQQQKTIEEAVIENMSVKDKIVRLYEELKSLREPSEEYLCRLVEWLRLDFNALPNHIKKLLKTERSCKNA